MGYFYFIFPNWLRQIAEKTWDLQVKTKATFAIWKKPANLSKSSCPKKTSKIGLIRRLLLRPRIHTAEPGFFSYKFFEFDFFFFAFFSKKYLRWNYQNKFVGEFGVMTQHMKMSHPFVDVNLSETKKYCSYKFYIIKCFLHYLIVLEHEKTWSG